MGKIIFSEQKGKAYYYNSINEFILQDTNSIIGELIKKSFEHSKEQTDAWENQINELKEKLKINGVNGDVIFEYDIVRLGKRIDVILLIKNMVFSLEFKNGKNLFVASDARQAEDYAIDIKNFHKESADLYVCPILIATKAPKYSKPQSLETYPDKQIYLQRENSETFISKIIEVSEKYGDNDKKIDFNKWFNSPYYPTPTIIDAAVQAYNSKELSEIARSEAGQENVEKCVKRVNDIIEHARNNKKKCICFITGVPGAGKTLVGLDIVSKNLSKKNSDYSSVYLSGNGPLVEVLRAALIKSTKDDKTYKKNITQQAVEALIQSSYNFKNDNVSRTEPTHEHILIFDEAQRVWDKQKMYTKHNKAEQMNLSEPQLLMNIMDRHNDWAVMICLVGLGQDIYDGEVGINEWFNCGINNFENWDLYYSPLIFSQIEDKSIDKNMIINCSRCHEIDELHLRTSIRSFRSESQCEFVDSLLDNDPDKAKKIYNKINDKYPIYVTRDYSSARRWIRNKVRGSQRSGVIASSGAQRLKPEGIYVPTKIDVTNWFLADPEDLRSSNKMEIVASEFKVQGLELDWSIVCWDADLRRSGKSWDYYRFRGANWQKRKQENDQRYLVNSYRVLLTRARQGMVIFVPHGVSEEEDNTRNSKYYDSIFNYLKLCGIEDLPND